MEYFPLPEKYEYVMPSGRKRLIQYMAEKFGQDSICQIVAFGTMQTRLILKDTARILGLDYNEINDINKMVPSDAGFQWKISECLYGSRDGEKAPIPAFAEYYEKHPELFDTALELEGNPRHTSIHAAGVILAPGRVRDFLPLMIGDAGEIVSQWDMKDVDFIGCVKIDLLGIRNLGVYARTNQLINARHGITIDTYKIPRDDPMAMELIKNGWTKSLFQIESSGMTGIFKALKKVDFETIVAILALNR